METTLSTVETAEEMCSQTAPVVVIQEGRKAPKTRPNTEPRPDGTKPMWVLDDPAEASGAFKNPANIAVLLGQEKDHPFSPLIAVGLDLYKDRRVADKAKDLGVTSSANAWILRTGRGGNTLIYLHPDIELKRDTTQEGASLDLLVHGYTLISPSNTNRMPDGGGPYTWVKGHSPWDIPLVDLEEPPQKLLSWWQELHAAPLPHTYPGNDAGASSKYQGPIPEGQRNTELASRAGYLHRMIPDDNMVRDLIHGINLHDCHPPLAHGEVEAILRSILPREGAGHFRGVQPAPMEPPCH